MTMKSAKISWIGKMRWRVWRCLDCFFLFLSSLPCRSSVVMTWCSDAEMIRSLRLDGRERSKAHDSRSLADGALPSWTVAHDRLSVLLIQNVKRRDKEAEREREKSGLFRRTTGKRKQTCPSTLRLGVHLDEKLWVGQFLLTISKTALGFMMNVVCGVLSVYSSRVFISACWIGEGGMERVRGGGVFVYQMFYHRMQRDLRVSSLTRLVALL